VTGKLFSLIKGGRFHTAPKTKVIPQNAFSELLEAKEVLEKVKEDAKTFRQAVAEECEALKEQAQKEGYEAGFQAWAEHIAKIQKEIDEVRNEFTKMLSPVALKAAKKIVGKTFELSQDAVFEIVANALRPVTQHKRITIWVNKNDQEVLEKNRTKLKELFENLEVLSIRDREDISQGGCVIETEGGIINAQLENQWAVLERAFETLFKSKKAAVQENSHEAKTKG
jgi:type III secretion protein L